MGAEDPATAFSAAPLKSGDMRWRREYFWPAVLVLIGVYLLLNNLGLLDRLRLDIVWPVLLILLGAWLIIRRQRQ